MARRAALAIAGAAMAYAGLLTWLRLDEGRLVYHAEPGKLRPAPAELGLDARDVRIVGLDSTPLVARIVPPPADVSADRAPWILYFHGAGGNVGTPGYDRDQVDSPAIEAGLSWFRRAPDRERTGRPIGDPLRSLPATS